jgi:hypothetical protein
MRTYILFGKITVVTYIDAGNEDAAIEEAKTRSVAVRHQPKR